MADDCETPPPTLRIPAFQSPVTPPPTLRIPAFQSPVTPPPTLRIPASRSPVTPPPTLRNPASPSPVTPPPTLRNPSPPMMMMMITKNKKSHTNRAPNPPPNGLDIYIDTPNRTSSERKRFRFRSIPVAPDFDSAAPVEVVQKKEKKSKKSKEEEEERRRVATRALLKFYR